MIDWLPRRRQHKSNASDQIKQHDSAETLISILNLMRRTGWGSSD